jgi:hypothetical protein
MVGCAPYSSISGRLMSSIKITIDSLGLAPKTVFAFLLSLDYMASWVYLGLVLAEKFKKIVLTPYYFIWNRYGTINEVFPTPDSPVINNGLLIFNKICIICLHFSVSIVGTIIS